MLTNFALLLAADPVPDWNTVLGALAGTTFPAILAWFRRAKKRVDDLLEEVEKYKTRLDMIERVLEIGGGKNVPTSHTPNPKP